MMGAAATAPYIAGALGGGGAGAAVSHNPEIVRRWRTWAVTAPLVVGALWLGAPGATALAAGLGVIAAAEYGRLARLPAADRIFIGAAAVALPLIAWLRPGALAKALACAILAAALIPVLAGDAEGGARRAAAGAFGVAWLAALSGLVLLGPRALPLVIAVCVADVGAWCGGRLLGGPYLSGLSPAKRWTGVLGGAVAGCGTLALFGALTPGLAVAVVVGAPLGDLLESMLKRGAGVKDAGGWLPGFGGLLDRIDSLLIVLAMAVIL